MTSTSRITVPVAASLAGIRAAADALEAFRVDRGLNQEAGWPAQVALDEILSNIVGHGRVAGQDRFIEVTFGLIDDNLQLAIVDDGPEVDPLLAPEPDTTLPLEERRPGGLGVYLVRHLCDHVQYTRVDGRNHLVLTFRDSKADRPQRGKG
jgi:serine/threonine-protein kinase RsbW